MEVSALRPVRTALVGVGGIGGYHRKVIHGLEDYEFVGAADRYPDRQAAHIEELREWGVPFFEDLWQMVEATEPEAVTVAVPHHYHAEYTMGCLDRGVHVMCEKPVTVRIQDALAEAKLAQDKGLLVGVDFQYASFPHSAALKQFIMDGGLGELRSVVGVMTWKRTDDYYTRADWVGRRFVDDRACFDGVLMNQAVHLVNSALQMGTREPGNATVRDMQAELYTVHDNIDTEDLACLRADLGEATLTFYATTCALELPEVTTLQITGSAGSASWDSSRAVVTLNSGEEVVFDQPTDRDEVHKNFIACIRKEARGLWAPVEEALKATLAINGAYLSAGRIKRIGWEAMEDITGFINRAAAQQKLFSEMGAGWAYEGARIDMTGYDSFEGKPLD